MNSDEIRLENAWQEACSLMEIANPAMRIETIVGEDRSPPLLLVRRLIVEHRRLETLLVVPHALKKNLLTMDSDLTSWQFQGFCSWLQRGKMETLHAERPPIGGPGPSVPHGLSGDITAVPLFNDLGAQGVLFIQLDASGSTSAIQRKFCALLRESFTAALDNHQPVPKRKAPRRKDASEERSFLTWLDHNDLVESVVGADGGLRKVMERVQMISDSDVPILILGETGSGKEVIARVIHAQSRCAEGPFLRVNCGAIPPELIDSELFGHEKGSFTGAIATRRGWFEQADGGTLLLDEIGELTLAAQVRLLRVLQDGSFQRVGGEKSLQSRVRIIAATNQNLAAMVHAGEFREDLWYRISVFPLLLPSLRERQEDIPALVNVLISQAARRFGVKVQQPSPADMALLVTYAWPGNVRELRSVIERATILGNGQCLKIETAMGISSTSMSMHSTAPFAPESLAAAEIVSLDEAIGRHITVALAACKGRIEGPQGAAALLRINPHTLRARMRKLGIDWTRFRV